MTTARNIETIQRLENAIPQMPVRDREFAQSLVNQFNRRGMLSDRQWPWVDTLMQRVYVQQGMAAAPRDENHIDGDFSRLFAWTQLSNARVGLNFGPIRVSRPSEQSRYHGQQVLFLRRGHAYLGIFRDNHYEPTPAATAEDVTRVREILRGLAADPVGYSAHVGRTTGRCCFCYRELTDQRSTSVGYGPICADRYSLPWGATPRAASRARAAATESALELDAESEVMRREQANAEGFLRSGNIMPPPVVRFRRESSFGTPATPPMVTMRRVATMPNPIPEALRGLEPTRVIRDEQEPPRDPNGPDDEDLLFM